MRRAAVIAALAALALEAAPAAAAPLPATPAPAMEAVIVTLGVHADLTGLPRTSRAARLQALIGRLQTTAARSQAPVMQVLAAQRSAGLVGRIVPLWVTNAIAVQATPTAISRLRALPGVAAVVPDTVIAAPAATAWAAPSAAVAAVNAEGMWNLGYRGQGVVVANLDTGVDIGHPELAATYRGGADSWYDPYGQHATPTDVNGHGTQTMSVMVAGDASGSSIGMAPAATWIAAKVFDDRGQATTSAIHQAFQWALDPDGNAATPDTPNVVSSSWTMGVGCTLEFEPDIQALRAANILPVFAAGNGGPYASSDESPGNNPGALAVGATGSGDTIASFSARGPTSCGLTQPAVFPDVVAPGVNVDVADLLGGYTTNTGTSFSAPAAAGALALLLSAAPGLTAAQQETAIESSAVDLGTAGPDSTYGFGRIDALAAYTSLPADTTGPAVTGVAWSAGTLTASATDAASAIAAAEWFEGADPGTGAGSPMAAADGTFDTASETVRADTSALAPGTHTLSVRALDAAGNWGQAATVTFSVPPPGLIFADDFGSGTLAAWSAATGTAGMAVSAGASLDGSDGMGLAVTMAGTAARYVTDQSPASETGYHARFYLSPGGACRATTLVLFAGESAQGRRLLALQCRQGTTAGAPVRLRATALTDTGSHVATPWTALAPGAHAVEVGWAAAAAGALTLAVDGSVVGSVSGFSDATRRLESVRLGPSAGMKKAAAGSLALDGFVSTRSGTIGP